MKSNKWIVHVNATCQDCGKHFSDYTKPNAAREHARKFKHNVTGEFGYAFEYNGKA
jgi:hypothetical protein